MATSADQSTSQDIEYGMSEEGSANAMLFAEEFIEYILKRLGFEWPPRPVSARSVSEFLTRKRFTPEIGEAALDIIHCNIEYYAACYNELRRMGIDNIDDYRREQCITAALLFKHGYDPDQFLCFAANLAAMSVFFFHCGDKKIADASAQIMAYILNYYIYQGAFLINRDYFRLCMFAQHIRRDFREGKRFPIVIDHASHSRKDK